MADEYVYHGSQIPDLKELEPKEAGFGKSYVYASTEIASAVIFMSRQRNSWQASWGGGEERPLYFCERVEGTLDKWYSGMKGSLYVFSKKDFHKIEGTSKYEVVSEKPVKVIKEIKIDDMKQFLLDLEKQGKLRIIMYKDRLERYPNDNDLVKMGIDGLNKYSVEFTIDAIRKYRPDLEEQFKKELEKTRKS